MSTGTAILNSMLNKLKRAARDVSKCSVVMCLFLLLAYFGASVVSAVPQEPIHDVIDLNHTDQVLVLVGEQESESVRSFEELFGEDVLHQIPLAVVCIVPQNIHVQFRTFLSGPRLVSEYLPLSLIALPPPSALS